MKKTLILFGLSLLLSAPIFAQDIFTAIQTNDVAGVKYLLGKKININARNAEGLTALMAAVQSKQERVVKLLVESEADLNLKDKQGNTALIMACTAKFDAAVDVLVHHFPNLNSRNNDGATALIAAVNAGDIDAVKTLLAYEADAKVKDKQNKAAIDYAKATHNTQILTLLNGSVLAANE